MLPPSTPSPLHRIKVCSTAEFRATSSSSLLGRSTHSLPVFPLYLSLRTYFVFPSPRPIYLPLRVAEWILFVSHRYFCEPVRPPKLSRRHDLCFLRPSGGLIPFCCRMYIYVCAAASPVPFSVLSLRRCLPRAARARESTDLPHTTDYSRSSRSRRRVLLVPSLRGFFRDFFSAVPSSPFPPSLRPRSLPLTALYRLATSVSRARDLRASALGRTIEHYDLLVSGSFYIETSVMDKFKSLFLFASHLLYIFIYRVPSRDE